MFAHDARPHTARGAEFRHLFEEVVVASEKERQPWREAIYVQPGVDCRLHVRHPIGQRERHLLHRGAAGLAHVVTGNGDRVPLRHVLITEGK